MKYSKWQLTKRMANYIEKNKKLSPLNQLEYQFLRKIYWYLTKFKTDKEFKKDFYDIYIKLINLMHWCNREEINPEMLNIIFLQLEILLDRDFSGPYTFITLNNVSDYKEIKTVLKALKIWSLNPIYYGYASEKEFFSAMDILRKRIKKQDLYYQVGKWPREFRLRKGRKGKE